MTWPGGHIDSAGSVMSNGPAGAWFEMMARRAVLVVLAVETQSDG